MHFFTSLICTMIWDSRCTYSLSQILVDFTNSFLLWIDLHVKLEPSVHFFLSGSISLIRLKVFSFSSTLCSFLWICPVFRGWLSCSHLTFSLSGKKPLSVQMSLTGECLNSPSQIGCNVMFGETTRCAEIEKSFFYIFTYCLILHTGCGYFSNMSKLIVVSNTYHQVLVK